MSRSVGPTSCNCEGHRRRVHDVLLEGGGGVVGDGRRRAAAVRVEVVVARLLQHDLRQAGFQVGRARPEKEEYGTVCHP